jgi:hypothetical protein
MPTAARQHWIRTAVLLGLVYVMIGVVFAVLDGASTSSQGRIAWRWAAWVASAAVFAAHIRYEHFRLSNSTRDTALHTAAAVAVGGFGLAVWATAHSLFIASPDRRMRLFALALVVWPIITGVPAYLVAFAASTALNQLAAPRGQRR